MRAETESGISYGYIVVVAAFLVMVVMWGGYYAFGVFFKPLLHEFGWTRAMTSGAFSLSSMIMGLLGIVMGGLNDKFGPRIVMSLCGLLVGISYLLMSQVQSLWQLYLFCGVIMGIGMGGSFAPLMTTVARWFVERRGLMTGVVAAGIGIGAMLGPPVAHWLIHSYGWRVSYMVLGGIVLVVIVLCAQLLKRDSSQAAQNLSDGIQREGTGVEPINKGLSLKEALRTKSFWVFFGMILCFGFSVFSIMVHIAPHATELGISSKSAANILATIGGVSILGKVFMGSAVDYIGSRKVFVVCFILMLGALLWLMPATEVWMLYLFAALFGFAYGGCVVAESPLAAVLFGLHSHGVILGFIAFAFCAGGAFGPWVTGYIFDFASSYRFAFFCCAILSAMALMLTAILKPPKVMERG
jgi:MFS family permease